MTSFSMSTQWKAVIVVFTFVLLRYRKQMEEMQKAFNKTIIKLQNTSRIAQEQVSSHERQIS